MAKTLCALRGSRFVGSILLFCYVLTCLVLPFQHQHSVDEAFLLSPILHNATSPQSRSPHPVASASKAKTAHPTHCAACEWLNTDTSPAFSTSITTIVVAHSLLVATTLPRYLRSCPLSDVSRGPPAS